MTLPQFYTCAEAADKLHVCPSTIASLIRNKKLKATDIGQGKHRQWRISEAELIRFTERRTSEKEPRIKRVRRGVDPRLKGMKQFV